MTKQTIYCNLMSIPLMIFAYVLLKYVYYDNLFQGILLLIPATIIYALTMKHIFKPYEEKKDNDREREY